MIKIGKYVCPKDKHNHFLICLHIINYIIICKHGVQITPIKPRKRRGY